MSSSRTSWNMMKLNLMKMILFSLFSGHGEWLVRKRALKVAMDVHSRKWTSGIKRMGHISRFATAATATLTHSNCFRSSRRNNIRVAYCRDPRCLTLHRIPYPLLHHERADVRLLSIDYISTLFTSANATRPHAPFLHAYHWHICCWVHHCTLGSSYPPV
jgi:hypothetical protein